MRYFIRFTDTAYLDMDSESNDTIYGGSMGGLCGFQLDANENMSRLEILEEAKNMANRYASYYPYYTRENKGVALFEGKYLPVNSNDGEVFKPDSLLTTFNHD